MKQFKTILTEAADGFRSQDFRELWTVVNKGNALLFKGKGSKMLTIQFMPKIQKGLPKPGDGVTLKAMKDSDGSFDATATLARPIKRLIVRDKNMSWEFQAQISDALYQDLINNPGKEFKVLAKYGRVGG